MTDEQVHEEDLRALFRCEMGEDFEPIQAQDFGESKVASGGARRGNATAPAGLAAKHGAFRDSDQDRPEVALLTQGGDGVLRWEIGKREFSPIGSGRRSGKKGRAGLLESRVIDQYKFRSMDGSIVARELNKLDQRLTPNAFRESGPAVDNGVRQIKSGKFARAPDPEDLKGRRVFLFIHGTFSSCDNVIKDLKRTKSGRAFLQTVEAKYDYVLTFDHPTLSVSPILNAFDLAARLRAPMQSLDIVCHSRGGLVARWFCEAFLPATTIRRVIFVGSPLVGTSLAAAPKLRATCDYLSNLASMSSKALGYFPGAFAKFVGFQLKLISWISSGAAKTPLFDAAIAMVPGLDAQSREGNNFELEKLRANSATANFNDPKQIVYHAITSDFEPEPIGWKFWKIFHFPTAKDKTLDAGADVVFQEKNDLVVDTASMHELADDHFIENVHSYGTNSKVHHCNYFRFRTTFDQIRAWLQLPDE